MHSTLRTVGLFIMLTLLFVLVGYIIGILYGNIIITMLVFLGISILINVFSYFYSSKLVLWSYHAKIIGEQDNPRVFRIVSDLSVKANIAMPKIAIITTDVPNAFATGRNKNNAFVVVTTGILNTLNDDELEGVLGHELGHIKNRDMLLMTVAATIVGALTILFRVYFFESLFGGNGKREGNNVLVLVVLALAGIGATLLQLSISRQREYKADYTGAQLSGKPLALASALRKIEASVSRKPLRKGNPATASLFIINPFRGERFVSIFSTHPSTASRIEKLVEYSKKNLD
ncbi:MAG: zinc metalloprotease HtpX [Thermoplasmata archaeon]